MHTHTGKISVHKNSTAISALWKRMFVILCAKEFWSALLIFMACHQCCRFSDYVTIFSGIFKSLATKNYFLSLDNSSYFSSDFLPWWCYIPGIRIRHSWNDIRLILNWNWNFKTQLHQRRPKRVWLRVSGSMFLKLETTYSHFASMIIFCVKF